VVDWRKRTKAESDIRVPEETNVQHSNVTPTCHLPKCQRLGDEKVTKLQVKQICKETTVILSVATNDATWSVNQPVLLNYEHPIDVVA